MDTHPHCTRYARLVAGFTVSALALMMTLTMQLQEAATVTANVLDHAVVMTTYTQ